MAGGAAGGAVARVEEGSEAAMEVEVRVEEDSAAATAEGAAGAAAKGAGGTAGAETAGAATAAGATATRTWKRCAPRQGSRCDSCRARRWSHTSRRSGCNQMQKGRPLRAPQTSSLRLLCRHHSRLRRHHPRFRRLRQLTAASRAAAERAERAAGYGGSRIVWKCLSRSRPQTCRPRSGSDRGDPSSSRAGCRFERGSRATSGCSGS